MATPLVLWPLAQGLADPPPTGAGGPARVGDVPAPAPTGAGVIVPTTATSQTKPADVPTGGPGSFILPVVLMLVVLYFFMFKGNRKEDKRRKQLLAELKKGDKIMTIGGMVANVVSVDGDEVVLKIDESANVKARYRKSAIQEVLGAEEKK